MSFKIIDFVYIIFNIMKSLNIHCISYTKDVLFTY